eukprot:PhM_4_TR15337/c0_g1_i1/m.23794
MHITFFQTPKKSLTQKKSKFIIPFSPFPFFFKNELFLLLRLIEDNLEVLHSLVLCMCGVLGLLLRRGRVQHHREPVVLLLHAVRWVGEVEEVAERLVPQQDGLQQTHTGEPEPIAEHGRGLVVRKVEEHNRTQSDRIARIHSQRTTRTFVERLVELKIAEEEPHAHDGHDHEGIGHRQIRDPPERGRLERVLVRREVANGHEGRDHDRHRHHLRRGLHLAAVVLLVQELLLPVDAVLDELTLGAANLAVVLHLVHAVVQHCDLRLDASETELVSVDVHGRNHRDASDHNTPHEEDTAPRDIPADVHRRHELRLFLDRGKQRDERVPGVLDVLKRSLLRGDVVLDLRRGVLEHVGQLVGLGTFALEPLRRLQDDCA